MNNKQQLNVFGKDQDSCVYRNITIFLCWKSPLNEMWWLKLVNPNYSEMGRITVWGQPWQKVIETPISTNSWNSWVWCRAPVIYAGSIK
jgi:hypothetical protein